MTSVTFSSSVGGDNSTVSDDGDPNTGLANGGHRLRFVPALAQIVALANFILGKANAAAASAASAANAPGTNATTSTSVSVSTGSKPITLNQTGKAYSVGQTIVIASAANPNNAVTGPITAFNSGTGAMTINATAAQGSGSFSDGVVSLSAVGGVLPTRSITGSGLASGGGDLSADRTITVTGANVAAVRAGTTTGQAMTPGDTYNALAEVVLQDGASIVTSGDANLDMAKFINGVVTVAGNRTLPNPVNLKPGQAGRIRIVQDATGNRLLSFGSFWKRQGGAGSLSTTAGTQDFLVYDVVTTNYIIYDIIRSPT